MIRVDVSPTDPAGLLAAGAFGAGALVRLERGAASSGPFTEITTIALVATTLTYTYWDQGGDGTSWYQWRVSNVGNTVQSPYSDPLQGTSPTGSVLPNSYATMDRALGIFKTRPNKAADIARLGQLLVVATSQVIDECGHRDYFRHPASGTATWTADGNGSASLHVHEGLISLSLLELSFDGGITYVSVPATDYALRGDSPFSAEPVPAGEPYFHVRFTRFGGYTNFPQTHASVRLTGARGWPAVPTTLVEATVHRMRQLASAEGSFSGIVAGGPDEYGRIAPADRFWPQSLYNFLRAEHERFMGCTVSFR